MEYQTEVEIELDVEEEKLQRSRTRFKRQRIHLNHSNIEQAAASKEVAEWRDSVKVQAAEDMETESKTHGTDMRK